jgi:hypothetical protein
MNQWILDEKFTYVIFQDGRIDTIYDIYDDYVNYIYDTNKNLIHEYDVWLDTPPSDYDTSYITDYILDSNGKRILSYEYEWNDDSNAFVLWDKDSFAYNIEGKKTSMTSFFYENDHFEKSYKYEYIYDSNGIQTSFLECDWNSSSNQWDSTEKRMYFYDSTGNTIEEIFYSYTTEWVPDWRLVYYYNYSYTISDLIIPIYDARCFWNDNVPVNMPTGHIEFTYFNDDWEISDTGIYNYSLETLQHIHTPSVENIRVYPNPANDFITIKGVAENQGEIYIIDQYGRNKMSKHYTCGQKIPVSNLQTGVYFYQIITTDNTYSGTLIIQ